MKISAIIFFGLLLTAPLVSHAEDLVYTVQAASFEKVEDAEKQYDTVKQLLDEKELYYLRIEKVGRFFSVRIGEFVDYAAAKKFVRMVRPRVSSAIILKAYIKNERIIRLYLGTRYSLISPLSVSEAAQFDH